MIRRARSCGWWEIATRCTARGISRTRAPDSSPASACTGPRRPRSASPAQPPARGGICQCDAVRTSCIRPRRRRAPVQVALLCGRVHSRSSLAIVPAAAPVAVELTHIRSPTFGAMRRLCGHAHALASEWCRRRTGRAAGSGAIYICRHTLPLAASASAFISASASASNASPMSPLVLAATSSLVPRSARSRQRIATP